jgi:hypothetical protein
MSSSKFNSKPHSKSQTSVQSAAIKQGSKINVETQSKSQTSVQSAVKNLENKIIVESKDIFEGIF